MERLWHMSKVPILGPGPKAGKLTRCLLSAEMSPSDAFIRPQFGLLDPLLAFLSSVCAIFLILRALFNQHRALLDPECHLSPLFAFLRTICDILSTQHAIVSLLYAHLSSVCGLYSVRHVPFSS